MVEALHRGQGAPAPPQLQACGPCQGWPGWFTDPARVIAGEAFDRRRHLTTTYARPPENPAGAPRRAGRSVNRRSLVRLSDSRPTVSSWAVIFLRGNRNGNPNAYQW
jgi:hypothetical protein